MFQKKPEEGSVLGPILLVLYINDIDECINSKILKFADDTKIYLTVNSLEAIDSLRADLHKLVSWSVDWLMIFNIDKKTLLPQVVRHSLTITRSITLQNTRQ